MKNKKLIIGIAVGVVLIAAIAIVMFVAGNVVNKKGTNEEKKNTVKNITIEVTTKEKKTETFKVTTKSEFLLDALNETEGLEIKHEMTEDGAVVRGVNTTVVDGSRTFFSIMINDDYCKKTVDKQKIADGDVVKISYSEM